MGIGQLVPAAWVTQERSMVNGVDIVRRIYGAVAEVTDITTFTA